MRIGPAPALVSLLLAAAAGATPEPPRQEERQLPTFRTGVSAVLVDVLVLDGAGNAVTGLALEDFTVEEDGVRQTIATFDVTDWTSYVAAKTGESGEAGSGINTYPRRFVFVVNRQGARFEHLNRAKRALGTFIVESMAEGDEAMVIDVGYSMKVEQEFRAAKEETLETVRRLSQMQIDYPMGPDRAAERFYRDLEALGDSLASVPGRKVVILFSNELLTFAAPGSDMVDGGHSLRRAIDALNQSNASIYAIDIRGPESRTSVYGGLAPLASETGGRYFWSSPSFEPALRRVGRENQRYYLLGYVPLNAEADGSFRKIDVRVNVPDVEVVARKGYRAQAAETRTSDDRNEAEPGAGTGRPSPAAAPELPLALELTTYLLPTGRGPVRVPVSIALPEELLTGDGGTERKLRVTVADEEGTLVEAFEEPVSLARYYVTKNLTLAPGLYLLEVSVSSERQELHKASTGIRIPAGFGDRFGLSSIVPVVSPDAAAGVGDDLPLLPIAAVKRGESLHVLFQIFAGKADRARRARVSYVIFDEGGREALSAGGDEDIVLSDRPDGTPVILSLPTRSLSYGRYRVEVRVEDPSAGRRATSEIEFRVR